MFKLGDIVEVVKEIRLRSGPSEAHVIFTPGNRYTVTEVCIDFFNRPDVLTKVKLYKTALSVPQVYYDLAVAFGYKTIEEGAKRIQGILGDASKAEALQRWMTFAYRGENVLALLKIYEDVKSIPSK